ncbi:unnamed protein product [Ilex paraguariensis]|uniref:Pentatricopeptide repeat-containing protein n=1 Tax=Ilex paraguariensis TaxID=185542 RepID=A0ABC8U1G8_9AQUA
MHGNSFDEMVEKDVSWTTLISDLATHECYYEALYLFRRMIVDESEVQPNVVTVVSVMSACCNLGSLNHSKCLPAFLERAGLVRLDVSIGNSLIDAYAKCGRIDYAAEVFNDMQNSHRDIYSWTAIISGLAMHGRGTDATTMFSQMNLVSGMIPDAITFIAVLSACAHSGLVEEGLCIFESMKAEYGIDPELKHYGCMVDLLGRAGLLECAYGFVKMMPMEPSLAILVSLLSACRLHHNVELGEELLKKIELLGLVVELLCFYPICMRMRINGTKSLTLGRR